MKFKNSLGPANLLKLRFVSVCAFFVFFYVTGSIVEAQTLNITSAPYNATTGSADNAAAIQAAINAVGTGGTVLVPSGTFLSGPVTLKSNMTFQLAAGSILRMTAMGTFPASSDFVYGSSLTNITINGTGVMDGQGAAWWAAFNASSSTTRPAAMIYLTNCTGVTLTGITVKDSPMFHVQLLGNGSNIYVGGVTITAAWPSPNTDGIDLRGKNVLIENCYISDGDDMIQLGGSQAVAGVTIRNCAFGTGHGLSIGGYTQGGVSDLLVDNCTFTGSQYGIRWKTGRDRGGVINNLTYSNLTMTGILSYPFFLTSWYPNPSSLPPTSDTAAAITSTTPYWSNIVLRNITASVASGAKSPGIMWAVPEAPVSNVLLDAVTVTGPSGVNFEFHHARGVTIMCNVRVDGQAPPTDIGAFDATITYPPCGSNPTPTFTFTPMPATNTPTRTNTPVPPTSTFTFTLTKTNTPVPSTATFSSTTTNTLSPTGTNTATRTNTPVPPTSTFTQTFTNSATPTRTNTPVPPTATFTNTSTKSNTPVPPTATFSNTPVPPTSTFTSTLTNTFVPPTSTFTNTVTPSATSTNSPVPPTLTFTKTGTPSFTSTFTAVPPTNTFTNTPMPPTSTFTRTSTPSFTFTNSPVPPTLTFKTTPVPPTSTFTPVPPTNTSTNTPMPPTLTFTALPTRTNTPLPPTNTDTPVPPTNTNTPVPPSSTPTFTHTFTAVPPTATHTPVPPTFTATSSPTSVPPTATNTNSPVPSTSTNTPLSTSTNTPLPPTSTNTPVPPTSTATLSPTSAPPTATNTDTLTTTPSSTSTRTPVPPTSTNTPVPPTMTFTHTPVPPTSTFTRTMTPSFTSTFTPVPPTNTFTTTLVPPTATFTAVPPTSTFSPVPPTFTPTASNTLTPTVTSTNSVTRTATPSTTFTSTPTFTPVSGIKVVLYPNPATGPAPIHVQITGLTQSSYVTVELFTVSFRKIWKESLGQMGPGTIDFTIPLTDQTGALIANGVYYVDVRIDGKHFIEKLLVMR